MKSRLILLSGILFLVSTFIAQGQQLYLNGRLLYKYGVVGNSKETEEIFLDRNPRHLLFDKKGIQVVAVRYSNHSAEKFASRNIQVGFTATLGDMEVFVYNRINNVRELSVSQMAFGAFILAFAIMHLLLYIFYPVRSRAWAEDKSTGSRTASAQQSGSEWKFRFVTDRPKNDPFASSAVCEPETSAGSTGLLTE